MSFATAVDRVRADFVEQPRLELTVPRAARLWNLGADDCRYVLDSLCDAGFLQWTAKRTVVRTGRGLGLGPAPQPAPVPVRRPPNADTSVGD